MFISWKPPPPSYLQVNLDGNISGNKAVWALSFMALFWTYWQLGGVIYMSQWSLGLNCVVLGQVFLMPRRFYELTILLLRQSHYCGYLDPREYAGGGYILSSQWYCCYVEGCMPVIVQHACCEVNSAIDWIAIYVAEHSSDHLWTDMREVSGYFKDILLSFFLGCIHTRFVWILRLIKKKSLLQL